MTGTPALFDFFNEVLLSTSLAEAGRLLALTASLAEAGRELELTESLASAVRLTLLLDFPSEGRRLFFDPVLGVVSSGNSFISS